MYNGGQKGQPLPRDKEIKQFLFPSCFPLLLGIDICYFFLRGGFPASLLTPPLLGCSMSAVPIIPTSYIQNSLITRGSCLNCYHKRRDFICTTVCCHSVQMTDHSHQRSTNSSYSMHWSVWGIFIM